MTAIVASASPAPAAAGTSQFGPPPHSRAIAVVGHVMVAKSGARVPIQANGHYVGYLIRLNRVAAFSGESPGAELPGCGL